MFELIVILLAVAAAILWNRIKQLESSVSALQDALSWGAQSREIAVPETSAEQASAIAATRMEPVDEVAPPQAALGKQQSEPELSQPVPALSPEPAPMSETAHYHSEAESVTHVFHAESASEGSSASSFSLPKISFNFEDIFGRLLPIWAGGITLAVAGFFLVRYSIETGLLTPSVRVAMGFLFGLGLLGAAELANRMAERITDPRVAQALSGAGIATLYASFYLAGSGYGLIGSSIAFVGLAGVTLAAILLSYRFGLPSAVLGLIGGFAAPILAGGDEGNLPLLATYLGLVTAGLVLTGERQKRAWLGIIALFFGLAWGALLLFGGASGPVEAIALGVYLIVVGAAIPAFAGRAFSASILRIVAGGLATVQMAVLVHQGGYDLLAWGLFGLLSAALAFLGWSKPQLREGSAIAAATSVCLLVLWPTPDSTYFAIVAVMLVILFAAIPLALFKMERARFADFGMLALFPLGLLVAANWQFGGWIITVQDGVLAAVALSLAAFPAVGAWLTWPRDDAAISDQTLGLLTSATIATFAAGLLALPAWATPFVALGIAAALVWLLRRMDSRQVDALLWLAAFVGVFCLFDLPEFFTEWRQIERGTNDYPVWKAAIRWTSVAVTFAILSLRRSMHLPARCAEAIAAIFAIPVLLLFVPDDALPLIAAAVCAGFAWQLKHRLGVQAVALLVTLTWAFVPLLAWADAAFASLGGFPVMASELIRWQEVFSHIAPFIVAAGATASARRGDGARGFVLGFIPAFAALAVALHILFKQVFFALLEQADFVALGMAERTVWEAALLGSAFALHRLLPGKEWAGQAALALCAAAIAHFCWYTGMLHNPLWDTQSVGALPLINWLLPAYALPIMVFAYARGISPKEPFNARPVIDAIIMGLISLLALSELRHAFAGTLLTSIPVGQTEDLLRSLLGIVLAIGFLLCGARSGERSWRIGSLVLMLVAVGKVFLFDAAGLEGLARIASFMALGFSLIGIGWFYARQLRGLTTGEGQANAQVEAAQT